MRRALAVLGVLGFVVTSCGSGASPLATIRAAAAKTGAATTAHVALTVKAERGPFARGTTYTGGFDFAGRRGRLQFDPSTLGITALTGTIDAVFDYSNGSIVYIHLPQLASLYQGKTWVKVDVGAASSQTTGVDVSSLLQSSDPASGLRLLAGATQVTKVGSDVVRGTKTTHYHVIIDVNRAADQAPSQVQDAMRKLAALYIVKTVPVDAWLDSTNRVRRATVVVDPGNLKLPAQSAQSAEQSGKITITTELFDFGVTVDAAPPPADQITDLTQLQGRAPGP